MKTLTLNKIVAAVVVTCAITFVTLAALHIVALTQAGLIHWNY